MTVDELFNKYYDLYTDALAHSTETHDRIARRYEIYYGNKKTLNLTDPRQGTYSEKDVIPFRKMCFELVESQVDTSIPLAKVTPKFADDALVAHTAEEFLNLEADILNSEDINDVAEREVRIQGTGIYQIDWDETKSNARRHGDLTLKFIYLKDFIPQPFIEDPDDLEYVFIHSTTTVKKVKDMYGKDVMADNGSKNSVELVICWYLNDKGEVSKVIWTRFGLVVLYAMDNYFARKKLVCSKCGEPAKKGQDACPVCGNKGTTYIDKDYYEVPEDLYALDTATGKQQVYLKQGTRVPLYRIKSLPFVLRQNISRAGGGLFGISDVDLLEEAQDGNNKVLGKIANTVMQGGSLITIPANASIDNKAGVLKVVRIQDPRQKSLISVNPIQANVQQDDILQDRLYQIGRQGVGITDAYQGKRDPTAESGKAKEISAMQTAGRLESKYVNKTTAYAKIYQKMFQFLLAFSDEKRRMIKPYGSISQIEEATFSKVNFIVNDGDEPFFNDDFIFSTNGSYTLSNKKDSLWNATTQQFMAGGFGNPQDPRVVYTYWKIMERYSYPLATKVIQFLDENQTRLPPEIEQALVQNPELLNQLMSVIQAKTNIAQKTAEAEAQKSEEILNPTAQPVEAGTTEAKKPTGGK